MPRAARWAACPFKRRGEHGRCFSSVPRTPPPWLLSVQPVEQHTRPKSPGTTPIRGSAGQGQRDTSHRLNPVEAALVDAFTRLAADAVRVSGLRGTEAAPHYRGGGDIDLGCAPRDETAVVRAIEEKCLEHGVTIVSKHSASSMVQLQLYARSAKSEHHHLCVDIHTRETCFGVPFMDHADVASTPATHDAPDRIDPTQGALLDFLTPYLSGLSVHPEYLSRLKSAFERSPESLEALVTALVGTRCGERFTAALRADAPAEALAHVARGFRRALLRRATLRRPRRALFGALHCAWAARIRPLFCPRGTLVVLLGTDGTGKTTLAERMLTELRPSYRSAQNRIVKLRPGLLPQLGRFMGRRPSMSDYERPHLSLIHI